MATDIAAAAILLLCHLGTFVAGQNDFYTQLSIVPDLLTAPPPDMVSVLYEGGVHIVGGETLDPRKLRIPPMYSWEFDEEKRYTVLMIDIDVPSRDFPVKTPILHFCAMNITGNDVYYGDIVQDYTAPFPLPISGLHRYCFLIYVETPETSSPGFTYRLPTGRLNFDLNKFVEDFKLIQYPKAGNCFRAEFSGF